jgi:hypothetical protein
MRLGGYIPTGLSPNFPAFTAGNSLTHTGRIQGKSLPAQGRKEERGIRGLLSVHYASMDK